MSRKIEVSGKLSETEVNIPDSRIDVKIPDSEVVFKYRNYKPALIEDTSKITLGILKNEMSFGDNESSIELIGVIGDYGTGKTSYIKTSVDEINKVRKGENKNLLNAHYVNIIKFQSGARSDAENKITASGNSSEENDTDEVLQKELLRYFEIYDSSEFINEVIDMTLELQNMKDELDKDNKKIGFIKKFAKLVSLKPEKSGDFVKLKDKAANLLNTAILMKPELLIAKAIGKHVLEIVGDTRGPEDEKRISDAIVKIGNYEALISRISGNEFSKNVLGDNIMLIASFLAMKDINYVVFEDIDRYDNIEIYRLIYNTINLIKSTKLNLKVKFIVPMRGELFDSESNDLYKFFDTTVSIIPHSNRFNCVDLMKKGLLEIGITNVRNDLLYSLGKYYVDKRKMNAILNDIYLYKNEITIYKNQTTESGEYSKFDYLFALMVYKNHNMKEFNKLYRNKSIFPELIVWKRNANNEIEKKEWTRALISKLIIDNKYSNIEHVVEINFVKDKTVEVDTFYGHTGSKTSSIIVSDLLVFQREEKTIETIKISDLELFLLNENLITENYMYYISEPESEVFTSDEMMFLMNVECNPRGLTDVKLNNVVDIVKIHSPSYFKRPAMLNYEIFKFFCINYESTQFSRKAELYKELILDNFGLDENNVKSMLNKYIASEQKSEYINELIVGDTANISNLLDKNNCDAYSNMYIPMLYPIEFTKNICDFIGESKTRFLCFTKLSEIDAKLEVISQDNYKFDISDYFDDKMKEMFELFLKYNIVEINLNLLNTFKRIYLADKGLSLYNLSSINSAKVKQYIISNQNEIIIQLYSNLDNTCDVTLAEIQKVSELGEVSNQFSILENIYKSDLKITEFTIPSNFNFNIIYKLVTNGNIDVTIANYAKISSKYPEIIGYTAVDKIIQYCNYPDSGILMDLLDKLSSKYRNDITANVIRNYPNNFQIAETIGRPWLTMAITARKVIFDQNTYNKLIVSSNYSTNYIGAFIKSMSIEEASNIQIDIKQIIDNIQSFELDKLKTQTSYTNISEQDITRILNLSHLNSAIRDDLILINCDHVAVIKRFCNASIKIIDQKLVSNVLDRLKDYYTFEESNGSKILNVETNSLLRDQKFTQRVGSYGYIVKNKNV